MLESRLTQTQFMKIPPITAVRHISVQTVYLTIVARREKNRSPIKHWSRAITFSLAMEVLIRS